MRSPHVIAAAVLVTLCSAAAAQDCGSLAGCVVPTLIVPADMPDSELIAAMPVTLLRTPLLEISPLTGQPLTVVYNDPARVPGAVNPGLRLVRLARGRAHRAGAILSRAY